MCILDTVSLSKIVTSQSWHCLHGNSLFIGSDHNNIIVACLHDAIFISVWSSVDLESLGPLLGQIVVALYPVVDEQPEKVAEIFKFLIVENRL